MIDGTLVTEIGKKHGKSGAQVSLKWVVQQGIVVLPKSSRKDYQLENIDLFGWELTEAELAQLTNLTRPQPQGAPMAHPATALCSEGFGWGPMQH